MKDVLKQLLVGNVGRSPINGIAKEIAAMLGSKVRPNSVVVVGEEYSPFKIPMHTEEFWCFLYISDKTFSFTAKCRGKRYCDFIAYMMVPVDYAFTEHCPAISAILGLPVYTCRAFTEDEVSEKLLSEKVVQMLHKMDFTSVSSLVISPVNLNATAQLRRPEEAVALAKIFRELATVVYKEAKERNQGTPRS